MQQMAEFQDKKRAQKEAEIAQGLEIIKAAEGQAKVEKEKDLLK